MKLIDKRMAAVNNLKLMDGRDWENGQACRSFFGCCVVTRRETRASGAGIGKMGKCRSFFSCCVVTRRETRGSGGGGVYSVIIA